MSNNDSLKVGKYAIKLIDRRKVTILIPPECIVPLPNSFGPATLNQLEELLLYPPVLQHLGGTRYKLIARHWLSNFIVDSRLDVFPAIILPKKDKEQASVFEDVRTRELGWLGLSAMAKTLDSVPSETNNVIAPATSREASTEAAFQDEPVSILQKPSEAVTVPQGTSDSSEPKDMLIPAESASIPPVDVSVTAPQDGPEAEDKWNLTDSREESRRTGRICPFCGGPLLCRSWPALTEPGFYRVVACDYRTSPKIKCKFKLDLTEWEYKVKFKKFKFRTSDFVRLIPDMTCKCKDTMYLRIIHTSETNIREELYCRTRLLDFTGRYSSDDFTMPEVKRRNLTIRKLREAISRAKLDIVYPDKKFDLPWLNELIADPDLPRAMDKRGLRSYVREGKVLADTVTHILNLENKKYDKIAIEKIMLFNRIRIERSFGVSPRLFQENADYCNHSEPKK